MGFVRDNTGIDLSNPFGARDTIEGAIDDLTGKTAGDAAANAASVQAAAGQSAIQAEQEAAARAQGFFDPLGGLAQQGADQSGFLTDPQAQFDFLQGNPLFKLALENANQGTLASAAAGGRLSAGDTLQDLSNNVLLSASPLISGQKQSIQNLLGLGSGIAGSRANIETGLGARTGGLLTDIGAARAGGLVGEANARAAGTQGIVQLGTDIGTTALTGGFG